MPEIRKKIELLQKIAHRFNEANIEWALGASMPVSYTHLDVYKRQFLQSLKTT